MNEKAIVPFRFVEAGICLNCGYDELYILEKDINGIRVEKDGSLTEVTNISHESKMVCIQCNTVFQYEKFGMYARPLTESEYKMKLEGKDNRILMVESENPFYKD